MAELMEPSDLVDAIYRYCDDVPTADPSHDDIAAVLEGARANGWRIVRFTEDYNEFPVPMLDPDGDAVLDAEWAPWVDVTDHVVDATIIPGRPDA